jgi:RNA polymerase sigma-70 factor (ECF subfamily)
VRDTSLSLLDQLQHSPDDQAWNRLVGLYAPLLMRWLKRYEVQNSDAEDLIQDVLLVVSRDLKGFDHAGHPGAFRSWLRTILVNRLRNFWRNRNQGPQAFGRSDIDQRLAELEDPASQLSQLWNKQHDRHVVLRLLALVEPHFEANTWKAFCRVALEGKRADVVAKELGISLNSVFISKSRILSRLRQEAEGLVDSAADFFPKS